MGIDNSKCRKIIRNGGIWIFSTLVFNIMYAYLSLIMSVFNHWIAKSLKIGPHASARASSHTALRSPPRPPCHGCVQACADSVCEGPISQSVSGPGRVHRSFPILTPQVAEIPVREVCVVFVFAEGVSTNRRK